MPTVPSMRFRRAPAPRLEAKPVEPHLVVKLPRDVEKKKGWSKTKALKDALQDAFREAWKAAIRVFAEVFLRIFKEEIEEYVDWNPGDILLKINLPIRGLRWFTIKRVRLSALKKWVED